MAINLVFLSLGSNLGNRVSNLEEALRALSSCGKIVSCSSVYESAPWGFTSEDHFYNICVGFETGHEALELLEVIGQIEHTLGRVRSGGGYTSRPIDIDIVFFNDAIIKSETLQIPHPHYRKRSFVLAPLAEIAAEYCDPQDGSAVNDLFSNCQDTLTILRKSLILNY